MKAEWRLLGLLAASAVALVWAVPFAWMAVAALRLGVPADIASLTPAGPFGLRNFRDAWQSGSFPLWYLNTIAVCGGIRRRAAAPLCRRDRPETAGVTVHENEPISNLPQPSSLFF
jgi:hypothetical protein